MIDMAMMVEDKESRASAFVIGNDFNLPVMFEQLDADYIEDVKNDVTMSPLQFAREYMSIWTGSSENSLVQLKDLERCQVLTEAEFEISKKIKDAMYIISVDVARSEKKTSATTAIAVFKIIPRGNGTFIKHLVYLSTYKGNMNFESQSVHIKALADKYNASMVVVDGNGLGKGLVDEMLKEDKYPSYSVVNDSTYDKYKQPNSLPLLFSITSNSSETRASDIHNLFMATISNHDLKLLVSESSAKEKLPRKIREENYEETQKLLMPHVETRLFIDEVMNISYNTTGKNQTSIKLISRRMGKDRYSAISYGLFYIGMLEKENKKKKRETFDTDSFIAIKRGKYKIFN